MSFDAEAQIVREIGKFLVNGGLYKGAKPVLVVGRRADRARRGRGRVSRPPLEHGLGALSGRAQPSQPALAGRGGGDLDDDALDPAGQPRDRLQRRARIRGACGSTPSARRAGPAPARRLLVAVPLIEEVAKRAGHRGPYGRGSVSRRRRSPARSRATRCSGQGYDFDGAAACRRFCRRPIPGHRARPHRARARRRRLGARPGERLAGARHGRAGRGLSARACRSSPAVRSIARTASRAMPNEAVIAAVEAAGGLLARGTLVHSYPHSWRSKAPLIFRNTPQWFISDGGERPAAEGAGGDRRRRAGSRRKASNRIDAMVESRPDWCVSRQRAWGVPIPVFVNRKTGEPLRDAGGRRARRRRGRARGRRCLVSRPTPRRFLGNALRPGASGTRSPTSSRCGSIRARRTPLCSSSGPSSNGRPRSISKAPTSIAAGFNPRCSRPAARAAAPPTKRC